MLRATQTKTELLGIPYLELPVAVRGCTGTGNTLQYCEYTAYLSSFCPIKHTSCQVTPVNYGKSLLLVQASPLESYTTWAL